MNDGDQGRAHTPGEPHERLFALRGAVQAERNDRDAILEATDALLGELMERNGLAAEAMVSCILTCTEDLNAEFPAVAARAIGLDAVPLLCTREMEVPGAMERVIRVMLHYYAPRDHAPHHTYLGEAKRLRADLHSAQ